MEAFDPDRPCEPYTSGVVLFDGMQLDGWRKKDA
jgi:hypothetical protein